jgi:tRNA A37 N6-isopentenylltransferase MiaA
MTADEAISVFSSYSAEEKKEFVAQLSYELTVIARGCYGEESDGPSDPRRLRRINEVQHRVCAFLWALLRGDPERYPDDVLIRIVLEQPDDELLRRDLSKTFARMMARRLTTA